MNKINFPQTFPTIHTERLILKQATIEDAEDMHIYLSNETVCRYMGIDAHETIEDTKGEIKWYDNIFKEQTGIRWGISLKDNPAIIGSCGFLNLEKRHCRTEIGYELHHDHWRKGIMKEAIAAVLRYGFQEMNLNRIEAIIDPENTSSIKLVEMLYFVKEGLLREYESGQKGFDNVFMYSILKMEFHRLYEMKNKAKSLY
ncbi:GNAT family N-acetyltransferase [Bacillus safensis]|uniref:GNAT family N-acetyltransferase n=1 Tax=Bacillus safensis TaxID=561879 RepID=UPI002282015D|nr:GNAT family N-acetyltransferase [Bacillus safensis]MCY7711172.1 GNAT family N-acetyltransferase [Bacillus safensis]MCY7727964.1 GNAT family N-acetyltransferase [Bacillus safensis]MED0884439.1 GNAT family N-acetyltransferase [Bacillus safensis]MED0916178.1 GNAT family N-acetyltransferase [Bacillus safensis]